LFIFAAIKPSPMPSHEDRYISKLLMGFGALIAGVMTIFYACFERLRYDDWYYWGLGASILFCLGSYLLLQAFVHKIKADFSRRQKSREQLRSGKEKEPSE
jgi:hypothetical protein